MGEPVLLDAKAARAVRIAADEPGHDRTTQDTTVALQDAFSKGAGPRPFNGKGIQDDPSRCHGPARFAGPLRFVVAANRQSEAGEAAGLPTHPLAKSPQAIAIGVRRTAPLAAAPENRA